MEKLNPIIEALDGIDETTALAAMEKPKLKKPLKLWIIAAAAVLTTGLIVGFSKVTFGNKNYVFEQYDGTKMYFDIHLKDNITVPEKYIDYDWVDHSAYSEREWIGVEKRPSELFAEFGLKPLTSDNFTEDFEFTYPGEEYLLRKDPAVRATTGSVDFQYVLYDKALGSEIFFTAEYFYGSHGYHGAKNGVEHEYEYVRLKDGTTCYVCDSVAWFSYDGAKYSVSVYGSNDRGIDGIKQILTDLGLL